MRFYKKGDPTVAIHVRKDDVRILINIALVCLSMIILMRCQEFFTLFLLAFSRDLPYFAQVSRMLPQMFAEQEVRVYVKKRDRTSVDTATKCFERWCASHKMMKPKVFFAIVLFLLEFGFHCCFLICQCSGAMIFGTVL